MGGSAILHRSKENVIFLSGRILTGGAEAHEVANS
jgi:hypothetical protein